MKRIKNELTGKALMALAKKATERAWNENFALGLPIVIAENGWVFKKYKDGKVELIKKLKKRPN